MNEEKSPLPQSLQGKLEVARKIGRFACLALILAICGSTVYNIFRLMEAPQSAENAEIEEVLPLFPVVAFDPDGKWEIAGFSPDAIANSPPLMPVPPNATLLGVRNDSSGRPQMQFYEIPEEAVTVSNEKRWEQNLVDSWIKLGWTMQPVETPEVISYECQKSGEHRLVQFFSEQNRYYLLLSRAGQ